MHGEPAQPPGIVLHGRPVVPEDALRFEFARSSGPGGQNVNKRSTKCQLRVALGDVALPHDAMERFAALAGGLIVGAGEVLIEADEFRSQSQNKDACVERLVQMLARALVRPKVRRKTRPSKGSVQRRINEKKRRGAIKRDRRREHD
jgi:ribosome-associated protein